MFQGVLKNEESGSIDIKIVNLNNFTPTSGENNSIKLNEERKVVTKGFTIIVKSLEDECPNLAKNKKNSFISFDEIIKKVKSNKKNKSFIETNEEHSSKNLEEFK